MKYSNLQGNNNYRGAISVQRPNGFLWVCETVEISCNRILAVWPTKNTDEDAWWLFSDCKMNATVKTQAFPSVSPGTLEAGIVESSQNGLRPASLLNLNHIWYKSVCLHIHPPIWSAWHRTPRSWPSRWRSITSCPGNISGFWSWCLGSAENHGVFPSGCLGQGWTGKMNGNKSMIS